MSNPSVDFRAAEEDVEAQRQELMAGFDDSLRKREHEFYRKKADDLSNCLLASEELPLRAVICNTLYRSKAEMLCGILISFSRNITQLSAIICSHAWMEFSAMWACSLQDRHIFLDKYSQNA